MAIRDWRTADYYILEFLFVSHAHFQAWRDRRAAGILEGLAPWRSGYAEVCKTSYTGSIPVGASSFDVKFTSCFTINTRVEIRKYYSQNKFDKTAGKWRNGIRDRLKICWPHGLEGSNPSLPTIKIMTTIKNTSPGRAPHFYQSGPCCGT